MKVQIVMALDVAEEEVVGPEKVGMSMNVFSGTKATLDVTNAVSLVTTIMSVLNGRDKRQTWSKKNLHYCEWKGDTGLVCILAYFSIVEFRDTFLANQLTK
ncbi:hypothetical protein OSB04_029250 [Centaurea solstitialis]|uniref:Uncharacterized protein n=1 Tax=Centaurea solstitialis TaxID=347529 RepID=A0AA38SH77_9ASTR|nr:hypothetical protein OSB04_029250 [Centaurea solstitialis]